MNIISIEPTPSPNTMKLTMSERLPEGVRRTCTPENRGEYPEYIQQLLSIEGVKSIYQVADFIAIERKAKGDWQKILAAARDVFGESHSPGQVSADSVESPISQGYGEVKVYIQTYKDIPMQIKLVTDGEERRVGLPERFMKAAMEAQASSGNLVKERIWEEHGVRYGTFEEIGEELIAELAAAYSEERLTKLVGLVIEKTPEKRPSIQRLTADEMLKQWDHPDWKHRFALLQQMKPDLTYLSVLKKALEDEHLSIRRLATAYLGMIDAPEVLPLLFQALEDQSPALRRTAGDALSDLGNPAAIGPMTKALRDPNKLVRWRAARFLYEVGDESALSALKAAEHDPEFEVSLQVKMAIERIEAGEEASGTVWQQMTNRMNED